MNIPSGSDFEHVWGRARGRDLHRRERPREAAARAPKPHGSFDPLWCRRVLMKVSISRGPLPRLIIRGAPPAPRAASPRRPSRLGVALDPRRLYVHEFAQLAVYVADVI